MAGVKSKAEYLKRYLEDEKKANRKKKPKSKVIIPRIKIVDKNIDVKAIKFGDELNEVGDAEEAPVVAEIIDERAIELKVRDVYAASLWKKLDSASGDEHSKSATNSSTQKVNNASMETHLQKKRSRADLSSGAESPPCNINPSQKQRERHHSGSDISPPRHIPNNTHHRSRKRHDSGSDISPPHQTKNNIQYQSRKHHDSGSDISPPRQTKNIQYQSRKHHDSGSDISPPRKSKNSQHQNRKRHNSANHSSQTKFNKRDSGHQGKRRHDSGRDISPPHLTKKQAGSKNLDNSGSDISPPRRSSQSTASKYKRHKGSDSDISPLRQTTTSKKSLGKRRDSGSDLSPTRKHSEDNLRPTKTLSGLKAGLQNAETLRHETQELRHREKTQIEKLGAELSGRDAQTIVRDRKTGKRRDVEKEDRDKEEENKRLAEQQKKYSEWGKGIEQTEHKKNKLSEDLYEMTKPLARHQGDDDLEEMLKSRIDTAEDPMAEYILKKRKKDDVARMPAYSGPPPPPNRFGLKPGYRWDGVDRSNGFEKKYFEKINTKKATEEEAYLWSVQDM